MGQTLPNGIYLPAEGERNCYDGLEGNWRSLDGLISTVAGKASATHTHGNITNDGKVGTTANLPLITGTGGAVQAGAFGNQANTFCEGNDSRLSDARTPVAHTHTKSDVTDLLNSNFIPSANNSYDLGSSSYQWNNLYAKNYFYNGTQWGLDQDNTWTGANSFYKSIQIHGGRNAYIMPEFAASYSGLSFGTVEFKQSFKFGDWVDNNSTIGLNTSNAYVEIYAGLDSSDNINKVRFHPSPNATTAELGTATAKWKTLNGINPGALSFPNLDVSKIVDFSTTLNDITKETATASKFSSTATATGWMTIIWYTRNLTPPHRVTIYTTMSGHDGDIRYNTFATSFANVTPDYYFCSSFPAVEGVKYWFETSFSNTTDGIVYHAYLLPCLGNVS